MPRRRESIARAQPREQRPRRRVEAGFVAALEQPGSEHAGERLAVLDSPLVEAVEVPDDSLDEDLVLVRREQRPEGSRRDALEEQHARRAVAGKRLVRFAWRRVAKSERRGLGER